MAEKETPRVTLPGSRRAPASGEPRGPVGADEEITVTVVLRRPLSTGKFAPDARLSRKEFADSFGAASGDIDVVTSFATAHGLDLAEVNSVARLVKLRGSAANMQSAFGVELMYFEHQGTKFRGREGTLTLPAQVNEVVEAVIGLDSRLQVRPHFVIGPGSPEDSEASEEPGAPSSYLPTEVADLYGFPTADGSGHCVGILEFGGGYREPDLDAYFTSLGLRKPAVVSIGVDEATNAPGGPDDLEVVLDVEIVGAIAPAAGIAVYFAPNNDQGFIDAVAAAVHDADNEPNVISISWGGPERSWTSQTMKALDGLFADARTMGIAIMVAAGDHGSADEPQTVQEQNGSIAKNPAYDGLAHVDFPASSPNVTSCGGTRLQASDGKIFAETVWNDNNGWATGGGVSDVFAPPAWQQPPPESINPGHRVGRGVPDVAGNADTRTGYQIYINGQSAVVGGTSAVAPLWSGLGVRLQQLSKGALRIDNDWLYSLPSSSFREIDSGTNAIPAGDSQPATKGYEAARGWDPCTGRGTPNGQDLAAQLGH